VEPEREQHRRGERVEGGEEEHRRGGRHGAWGEKLTRCPGPVAPGGHGGRERWSAGARAGRSAGGRTVAAPARGSLRAFPRPLRTPSHFETAAFNGGNCPPGERNPPRERTAW